MIIYIFKMILFFNSYIPGVGNVHAVSWVSRTKLFTSNIEVVEPPQAFLNVSIGPVTKDPVFHPQ